MAPGLRASPASVPGPDWHSFKDGKRRHLLYQSAPRSAIT